MSGAVRRRTTCRLCGSANVALAFSLAPTPPANAFVPGDQTAAQQERFPLDVFFCRDCTHVQLLDVVDPRLLFEHYVYVSGTSPSFVRHFEEYSDYVAGLAGLPNGALVVDIGSNDGTLLRAFRERHGARVLGIDPARNLAEAATKAGIETLPEFFSASLAGKLAAERGKAAVITANNVFAHVDDLGGVVDGVRSLLAPDGVFVFEVSYLLDVVGDILFDTIYHEHLAYHAVRSADSVLRAPRHGADRGSAGADPWRQPARHRAAARRAAQARRLGRGGARAGAEGGPREAGDLSGARTAHQCARCRNSARC